MRTDKKCVTPSAMRRLVVNADDLGVHPKIDEGVLLAAANGIVTSASVMVTGPSASEAVARARAQKIGLGVHLCLTTHLEPAAPALSVRQLAPGGRFRKDWKDFTLAWLAGLIPLAQIERELIAQVDKARELGFTPDHLDSHQHFHLMPGLRATVERIAHSFKLPLRWPHERPELKWLSKPGPALKTALLEGLALARPSAIAHRVSSYGIFDTNGLTEQKLIDRLRKLPEGDSEIFCHPGLNPGVIHLEPSWTYPWEQELSALTSPSVRHVLDERGIELTTYGKLSA